MVVGGIPELVVAAGADGILDKIESSGESGDTSAFLFFSPFTYHPSAWEGDTFRVHGAQVLDTKRLKIRRFLIETNASYR